MVGFETLGYFSQGFTPFDDDSDLSFCERVKKQISYTKSDRVTPEDWEEAARLLSPLFDVHPQDFAAFYSKEGLNPWEGAAFFEEGSLCYIHIHPNIGRSFFLRGYKKSEILSHEFVHAIRFGFPDSPFEEFLAYQTASNIFRKKIGPLFFSSKEPFIFLALSGASLVLELFDHWVGIFLPIAYLLFLSLRHLWYHKQFARASLLVQTLIKPSKSPLTLLARMSGAEILLFAKLSSHEARSWIFEKCQKSLRWCLINNKFIGSR